MSDGQLAAMIGGRDYSIHYGADFASSSLSGGNDIVLFSQGVPEPSTLALLGVGMFGLARRRRQARATHRA